jgi:hypothetical protein
MNKKMCLKINMPYSDYHNASISGCDSSIEYIEVKFYFTMEKVKQIMKETVKKENIHFSDNKAIISEEINLDEIIAALAKSISGPLKKFNVVDYNFSGLFDTSGRSIWIMVKFEKLHLISLIEYMCKTDLVVALQQSNLLEIQYDKKEG